MTIQQEVEKLLNGDAENNRIGLVQILSNNAKLADDLKSTLATEPSAESSAHLGNQAMHAAGQLWLGSIQASTLIALAPVNIALGILEPAQADG